MDKVEHVRRATQTRAHHCHWPGCDKQVPPAMWGCKAHWFALPNSMDSQEHEARRDGLDAARARVSAAGGPSIQELQQRFSRQEPKA